MILFLTILHVAVCFILVLVILLQAGRGQGLGNTFTSGNVQSLLGTRAGDFLTKVTSFAAICFLLTSISLDYLESRKSRSLFDASRPAQQIDLETLKKLAEKVKTENQTTPSQPTPTSEDVKSATSEVKASNEPSATDKT